MAAHSVALISDDSPERWLADHARGHSGAFDRVVSHFNGPIHAYLARCGLSEDEREDLSQEIFLRLHRSASRYQPERPARVWVFTVVANTARSYFRRRAVRDRSPAAHHLPKPVEPPQADAIHRGQEIARVLQGALDGLRLVQREVILLAVLQSMGVAEIADTLGLPPGTVKTHLHRGRLALAKALARAEAATDREQQ